MIFVVIGIIAGIAAHSTALLADAAHNMGDVLGLGAAWGATVLARRAVTQRRTYGLRRTTILAALANGGLVLFAIGGVVWEAVERLGAPPAVDGAIVAIVAAISPRMLVDVAKDMQRKFKIGHVTIQLEPIAHGDECEQAPAGTL